MFQAEIVGVFIGAEEATMRDGGLLRSVLLSSGTETLTLYVAEAGLDGFKAAQAITPGTFVRCGIAIRQEGFKKKINLVSIEPTNAVVAGSEAAAGKRETAGARS